MKQDEIIEMTRQAGGFAATPKFLEAFAKLVAAKEREACAMVCDLAAEQSGKTISEFGSNELMEKCVASGAMYQAKGLSKSIRARGEA